MTTWPVATASHAAFGPWIRRMRAGRPPASFNPRMMKTKASMMKEMTLCALAAPARSGAVTQAILKRSAKMPGMKTSCCANQSLSSA